MISFIQTLFDSKVKRHHEEKLRREREEEEARQVEAIAKKLLEEEEEAKRNQPYELTTQNDELTPIDATGNTMQDAFRRMLERRMLEQFQQEKQEQDNILSDETKVKSFPWSYLKWEAMEPNFDIAHPDVSSI